MYSYFALINSAIGIARKYINKDAATELIESMETTCFRNLKILVHLSCEAKDAIKRIEVVSKPSLAKSVNNLSAVIANT